MDISLPHSSTYTGRQTNCRDLQQARDVVYRVSVFSIANDVYRVFGRFTSCLILSRAKRRENVSVATKKSTAYMNAIGKTTKKAYVLAVALSLIR